MALDMYETRLPYWRPVKIYSDFLLDLMYTPFPQESTALPEVKAFHCM